MTKGINSIVKKDWKQQLEASSERYHIIGAWIAIIFDPVFGVTDYLNGIDGWEKILAFRLSVSIITLLTLLLRKKYHYSSLFLVFVPFMLISCQNAYTYGLISLENFTGHTLNYIALWIGAGLFILWSVRYSLIIVGISLIANIYFFSIHTEFSLNDALVNGGLLLIVVAIFTVILIQARYSLTIKTIKAQLALEKANDALQEQKQIVDKKNKSIMDSIRYAERIQNATLPPLSEIRKSLPESFIFFKPRDVVSGDFYWYWENEKYLLLAAMDCTGHGVPGAFMSMKGDALLHQILDVEKVIQPNLILEELNREITVGLKQNQTKNRDGMDGVVCVIDFEAKKLLFSGAKNPLIYFQEEVMTVIKGDIHPIGGGFQSNKGDTPVNYTLHEIDISKPTSFYIFSDGFQDQFGGESNKKFMIKNFRKLLHSIHLKPMPEQGEIIDKTISDYMEAGNTKQLDDMLVIGVRI